MGRGDKKSRRGKIFAGSFGKTRPKHKKINVPANAADSSAAAAAPVTAEKKPKVKVKAKAKDASPDLETQP